MSFSSEDHVCQLEDNLKLALFELKKCRTTNEQLLVEREDSEQEVLLILSTNKSLKCELAELHSQLLLVSEDRDQLQRQLDIVDQSCSEFEDALRRTSALEKQLREANNTIVLLQTEINNLKSSQTQSLFEELVTSPDISVASPTCSLSNQLATTTSINSSKNKMKKYSKLKNFIKKKQRISSRYNRNVNKLTKKCTDSSELLKEIEFYKQNIGKYECDTQRLESDLLYLSSSLVQLTKKYKTAQHEILEHESAMSSLLEQHFDKTSNHDCCCDCEPVSVSCSSPAVCITEAQCVDQLSSSPAQAPAAGISDKDNCAHNNNIVMYSDELGKHMGLQISQCVGQAIVNNCMPGASYSDILNTVLSAQFAKNTTLIILVGRRGNVGKKDLHNYFSQLNSLENIVQVVLFALPFSQSLTDFENNFRHDLNTIIHTLACRHSDKFHIIDTNIFIGKHFNLTKGSYFLSKYYKRQIAESLSYFLLNSANLLALLTTAPIEQCKNNIDIVCRPLESVPSTSFSLN